MLSTNSFAALKDKVVVITGGSRGIGKAVADAVVENGGNVVIGDILDKEGNATVEELNQKTGKKVAAFIHTDVRVYAQNQNLFKLAQSEFGGVDHVFLNAGINTNANSTFTPMDDQLEEKIIDVNTTAVIKGTKVALLHLAKRGGGSIVHLASVAGLASFPMLGSYNASKHAVVGYTKSFSLMPYICNVRVNAVCPYFVDTDITKPEQGAEKEFSSFKKYLEKIPWTQMTTVVEGVLNYFVDNSKNTEVVMALPDGLQVVDKFEAPASINNENTKAAEKEFFEQVITRSKVALEQALQEYGI